MLSRTRRAFHKMIQPPWSKYMQIAWSRPCMLLVIVILCGVLLLHVRVTSVSIFSAKTMVETQRKSKPGLFRDMLPINRFLLEILATPQLNVTIPRETISMSTPCKKEFDVSFLKVHKAGSTTLMNIFLRFAIENNLNIVLPRNSRGFGFNYLGYGKTISKDRIVPIPVNESYNILCNHVVYNRAAFRSVMPSDTVYVGILREPTSHFVSAASYYGFYKNLVKYMNGNSSNSNVIHEFLKNPRQYKNLGTYFIYNRMSFDFGIPKAKFHDIDFLSDYIAELDKDYSLVMLMERFPESLVLLRRTLCWTTKDIMYIPLNQHKNTPQFHLVDEDIAHLKQWNMADYMLYEHFRNVFDDKVQSQGVDLQEEVNSFKDIQETVKYFCDSVTHSPEYSTDSADLLTVPETKWGSSFVVTVYDCKLMTQPELPMLKRLIENAWNKVNKHSLKNYQKGFFERHAQ